MTGLMDEAIEALRLVPAERQDEIARAVMQAAGIDQPVYELTPDERADIREAKAEIERGDIATDDEVRAIWANYGL